MGFVSSGTSVQATAYLTERGRELLFNDGNIRFDSSGDDLFEIKEFALSDSDINYNTSSIPLAGQIADISGNNSGCLNSTSKLDQSTFIVYQGTISPSSVSYGTNLPGNSLTINVSNL